MKEKIDVLLEVKEEYLRFGAKLNTAIIEQSSEGAAWSRKDYASAKRAAMDFKRELTKLTQDSKYRWDR